MDVERVGPNQYRVGRHWVDLDEETRCHCGDHVWRGRECKHLRAVSEYLKRGQDSE